MESDEYRPPTPWIVWLLAAAMVLTYGAFVLTPLPQQNAIDAAFAVIPSRFNPENPARFTHWYEAAVPLFGHAFLHLAWWHAAINAFFFFMLGRQPAMKLGWWRFLTVFFSGAVLGGIAFVVLNWNSDQAAIGASGGVCGVFSAYFMSVGRSWRDAFTDPRLRGPLVMIFFLNVVLMGVAAEAGVFPIAWEGHLGGFVGGAFAYAILAPKPRGPWG